MYVCLKLLAVGATRAEKKISLYENDFEQGKR